MNFKMWTSKLRLLLILVVMETHMVSSFLPRRIKYAGCYEDVVKPKAVFLTCANKRGICEVRKSNVHILRIFFRPKLNSTDVESYGAWNSWFQMPLPNQDNEACKFLYHCPLKSNKLNSFTYKLTVDSFWPSNTFRVIWTLSDKETDEEIMCVKFKISIK